MSAFKIVNLYEENKTKEEKKLAEFIPNTDEGINYIIIGDTLYHYEDTSDTFEEGGGGKRKRRKAKKSRRKSRKGRKSRRKAAKKSRKTRRRRRRR